MRVLVSALAVLLVAASLTACQEEQHDTDAEELTLVNDEHQGSLELPDGSTIPVEVIAEIDHCDVMLGEPSSTSPS